MSEQGQGRTSEAMIDPIQPGTPDRVTAARRRRALAGAGVGLGVLAIIVVAFVLVGGGDPKQSAAPAPAAPTGAAAPSPPAPTAPSQDANAPAMPLPPGVDPALGEKPTVAAGSGTLRKLAVKPLIAGTGPKTTAGQTLMVNYVGAFYATGEEFDSSWKAGQPFQFQVGAGGVIEGWDRGLVGVPVGSRVQLDIPAAQAYGEKPEGGRPGGALRFVVDVLAAE